MYVAPLHRGLALALIALAVTSAQAQNASAIAGYTSGTHVIQLDGHDHSRCATHTPTEHEIMRVAAEIARTRARLGDALGRGGATTIPVAFHVVRSGNAVSQGNVTDQMIADQIDYMNDAWAGSNFQFSLASVDRTTNATWFNGCFGSQELPMKQALHIDPATTFNVYSCQPSSGILGYATFPWSYPESSYIHGIVVLHSSLPGGTAFPYNLGGTAAHEAGHYLGLYHTFQGACSGGDTPPGCQTGGDNVCDTAAESSPAFGCPNGRNTCSTGGPDPIHNYMDYTDDACYTELTPGQWERMDVMVATYKPTLLEGAEGVTITATASTLTVPQGGSVTFNYTIENNTDNAATGDLFFRAVLGQNTVAEGVILNDGTLPANQSFSGSFTQNIPQNAPPATYTYSLNVGQFPNAVLDSETFQITVTSDRVVALPSADWSVSGVTPWTAASVAAPAEAAVVAVPNPFAGQTSLRFTLEDAAQVRLAVYDLLGREVALLADGAMEAGVHEAVFQASGLAAGTYVYRLVVNDEAQTGRLLLAR